MKKEDIFVQLPDESYSGFTQKRTAVRLDEIIGYAEYSVPSKNRSECHVLLKHGSTIKTTMPYDDITKMLQMASTKMD